MARAIRDTSVPITHPKQCERDNYRRCPWNEGGKLADKYQDRGGADKVRLVDSPAGTPAVLVTIGDLVGVVYESKKWDGKPKRFLHEFGKHGRKRTQKPVLAVTPDGKQLYVLGGDYFVDERGIVG